MSRTYKVWIEIDSVKAQEIEDDVISQLADYTLQDESGGYRSYTLDEYILGGGTSEKEDYHDIREQIDRIDRKARFIIGYLCLEAPQIEFGAIKVKP